MRPLGNLVDVRHGIFVATDALLKQAHDALPQVAQVQLITHWMMFCQSVEHMLRTVLMLNYLCALLAAT